MPPINLLIKPASGLCNMRCRYCFYYDITQKRQQESFGFMDIPTMEAVIKKALAYSDDSCTFAFQGGEPTLVGLDFYKAVIEAEKKYNVKNVKIYHAIQTNGLDISEAFAKFLANEHFLVGISLDGTIHTHDAYRKDSKGEGTFYRIMKTIDLFNKYGVEYNILTVVNKKTASAVRKIYQFYKKNNFKYLQFIPCLDPLEEVAGNNEYSLTPTLYGEFLRTLFDLWYDDVSKGNEISIRQFENYIILLTGKQAESCDMNGYCSIQNVVEADGEVYPCDFFVLDAYKLGNLKYCDFEDINRRRKEIRFIEESFSHPDVCKECKYYGICRNGCKRHRVMSGDGSNYFCESYKIFFEHALDRLKNMALFFQSQP